MKLGWLVFWNGLKQLNANKTFFGFINLRPPLFINILLAFAFTAISFFINKQVFYLWLAAILLFVISFIIIVITRSKNKGVAKSLFFMPLFMMRQIFALTKIKKANTSFLKTEHSKLVYIEDLITHE